MISQETIARMKNAVQKKDIEITEVDPDTNSVCFTLPYSSAELSLTLESQDPKEQLAEFCEGVNSELGTMINHLDQTKFSKSEF